MNDYHITPHRPASEAVLVSGCSSGIGRATALALAGAGFPAVTARRAKARYKVGTQARLAPVARRIMGDRGWDVFMRRMVPFPAPQ